MSGAIVPTAISLGVYPASTAGLIALIARNWTFQERRDEAGKLVGLYGNRQYPEHDAIDAIKILGETDATAMRGRPAEQTVVAERDGTVPHVIEWLLNLPAPDSRLAPHLVVASSPPLWIPGR